jgi:hypothetical protein
MTTMIMVVVQEEAKGEDQMRLLYIIVYNTDHTVQSHSNG